MKFSQSIRIGKHRVGLGHPAYIIAEIGSNFDGNLKRAKHLAKLCKEAGADAFKIQNFTTPRLASSIGFKSLTAFEKKWGQPVVEVYKAAEFPHAWLKEIVGYCKKIGIDFLSSTYDREAVDLLDRLGMPAHKLGAGELDNLEFIEYVARTGKPVIMSAGAATQNEVETAVKVVRKTGNKNLILLQCNTSYPSPIADANLLAMVTFRDVFDVVVGYSDHTIGKEGGSDDPLGGFTVPLGAVALGGSVIEKHVTDDRTRKGPDHPFALTMDEFSAMVKGIRAMEQARGNGTKRVMPSEKNWRTTQRRGMYAVREVAKGEKFTRDMIVYLRPAIGLRPPMIKTILGKKAKRNISAGHAIRAEDVSK